MRLKQADFRAGLLHRRTRMQATNHGHEVTRPIGRDSSGIIVEWNPNLRSGGRESKVSRHHANHLPAYALDLDGAADDGGVRLEPLLPEFMAQDHAVVLAGDILATFKRTPQLRVCTQDRKQFRGNHGAGQA
jgi:hypothetical protein